MDSPAIRVMWMRLLGPDVNCRLADERMLRNTVLLTATLEKKMRNGLDPAELETSWRRLPGPQRRAVAADYVRSWPVPAQA